MEHLTANVKTSIHYRNNLIVNKNFCICFSTYQVHYKNNNPKNSNKYTLTAVQRTSEFYIYISLLNESRFSSATTKTKSKNNIYNHHQTISSVDIQREQEKILNYFLYIKQVHKIHKHFCLCNIAVAGPLLTRNS